MNKDVKQSVFGNELMMLYGRVNLSQGQFASLVGVSSVALRKWESGASCPKAESLKRALAVLISKGAFSEGEEQTEAMHLWGLANRRGLKVPFDERWFRGVMQGQAGTATGDTSELLLPADQGEEENLTWSPTLEEVDDSSRTTPGTGSHWSEAVETDRDKPCPVPCADPDPTSPAGFALAPGKTRGLSKGLLRLLIVLAILSIIGSVGTLFFQASRATTQANEAASEQASKTAIVQYPEYLSGSGILAFFDPLSQQDGSKWGSDRQSCQFTGGAYHIRKLPPGDFNRWCSAQGIFGNFAFEVQLTIMQGDCGGIAFRDDFKWHFYYFPICQDGTYKVVKCMSRGDSEDLQARNNPAIKTGLGQQNKIAVVANGSTMTFYINGQQIDQEQDGSYNSGHIELLAVPFYPVGHVTDVAYSNARLWIL